MSNPTPEERAEGMLRILKDELPDWKERWDRTGLREIVAEYVTIQIKEAESAAREEEREACAQVADGIKFADSCAHEGAAIIPSLETATRIASAIRNRGRKNE